MTYKAGIHTPSNIRYPWHDWCDGRVWKLNEGEHYDSFNSLQRCARYQAKRNRLKLTIIMSGKTATLKFWRK